MYNYKKGDVIARVIYGKIADVEVHREHKEIITCEDLYGGVPFQVRGYDLINTFVTASEYEDEISTTKTELAELLVNAGWHPFTVTFEKSNRSMRTLVGVLIQPEPLLGRSLVRDLELDYKNGFRLVDHRTIQWLIIDGVKYVLRDDHGKRVGEQKEVKQGRDRLGRFTSIAN